MDIHVWKHQQGEWQREAIKNGALGDPETAPPTALLAQPLPQGWVALNYQAEN